MLRRSLARCNSQSTGSWHNGNQVGNSLLTYTTMRPPRNKGVTIVPQGSAFVVERLGKFSRILKPGIHVLVPFIDSIRYAWSTKEIGVDVPSQSCVTRCGAAVTVDGILFFQITNPEEASYNIEFPVHQLVNLAQTAMRSQVGKATLDELFGERDSVNLSIISALRKESANWGINAQRYEVKSVDVSDAVKAAMDLEAEAERKKRRDVLTAEGERLAAIKLADAKAYAMTAAATAESEALRLNTEAVCQSLQQIAGTLEKGGKSMQDAVSLRLAEQYIEQFGHLAKETNSVILSQNTGDPAAMVAQAQSIFKTLSGGANSSSNSGKH